MPPKSFRDALGLGSANPAASAPATAASSSSASGAASTTSSQPTRATRAAAPRAPIFDYYIVLDFEATCEENVRIRDQEIIEFPMAAVDAQSLTVVSRFQRYVRPIANPMLSAFCTGLTGIVQAQVDTARTFPAVWTEVNDWLKALGVVGDSPTFSAAVVTCGDWDLKTMLPSQLRLLKLSNPPAIFASWINLKKAFQSRYPASPASGMTDLLSHFRLSLEGRHHSGIDDVNNITRVLIEMLKENPIDITSAPRTTPSWVAPADAVRTVPPTSLAPSAESAVAEAAAQAAAVAQPARQAQRGGGYRGGRGDGGEGRGGRGRFGVMQRESSGDGASAAAAPSGGEGSGLGPYLEVNCDAAIVKELLAANPPPSTDPEVVTQVSKKLTQILRHGALRARYPISVNGFIELDLILRRNSHLSLGSVLFATRDNSKQRLAIGRAADGKLYIRANQGHSIEGLQIDMRRVTSADEVPVAVHGTYYAAWDSIKRSGLNRMARNHIHFAAGLPGESGVISGMRSRSEILIYLDVPKALASGLELLVSANGVILSPGLGTTGEIPAALFLRVVDAVRGIDLTW